VKAVVTGGTGFIGRVLVRQLRKRGDDVVAIVRDPGHATALEQLEATLVAADLGVIDVTRLAEMLSGSDAVYHLAGSYRVGIPASEHVAMFAANVVATRTVLDAAIHAEVPRIVWQLAQACARKTCSPRRPAGVAGVERGLDWAASQARNRAGLSAKT